MGFYSHLHFPWTWLKPLKFVLISGEVSSPTVGNEIDNPTPIDEVVSGEDGCVSEDSESDEDYASIRRPAFLVEGEPDFDSGPPQDGLEYLRRVRYLSRSFFFSPLFSQ